jgi:hypothetical protein
MRSLEHPHGYSKIPVMTISIAATPAAHVSALFSR